MLCAWLNSPIAKVIKCSYYVRGNKCKSMTWDVNLTSKPQNSKVLKLFLKLIWLIVVLITYIIYFVVCIVDKGLLFVIFSEEKTEINIRILLIEDEERRTPVVTSNSVSRRPQLPQIEPGTFFSDAWCTSSCNKNRIIVMEHWLIIININLFYTPRSRLVRKKHWLWLYKICHLNRSNRYHGRSFRLRSKCAFHIIL